MAAATGITIEEFEKLPDALAHNHELVDGELVDVSGNTAYHNRLRDLVNRLLSGPVEEQNLGLVISEQEFDFGGDAYGPDVAFIGRSKLELIEDGRRVQRFVPDLAVEIVSQNDKFRYLSRKAACYLKSGTKEVWILDPDIRQSWVLSAERKVMLEEDQVFSSALIPGFAIRLGELFDRGRKR